VTAVNVDQFSQNAAMLQDDAANSACVGYRHNHVLAAVLNYVGQEIKIHLRVSVFLAQIVLDLTMASSRARTLEERIAAQASALLPPGSSSTNVVPLLERQLLATTSRSAPSPTLDTLNSLVNASRGNASGATSMKLDSIDLQPGRATLRLGGAAPEELAAWRGAWSAAGWQISEGNDPQGALVIELVRP
jgi:hypothetical protein